METIYKIETIKVALRVAELQHSKTGSSKAAAAILWGVYAQLDADQEHFCLLALDNKSNVRAYKILFSGSTTKSFIDLKILFRTALLLGTVRIVVAHNHPRGNPAPSPDDHQVTEMIARAAWFLNIGFNDHIILGDGRYFSFWDQGLLKSGTWDESQTCYHRFSEEILAEIKRLFPLADPVTERRVRRLLRDRGAGPADWKRLKLSKSEEMRIKKEYLLAKFIEELREMEDVEGLEALKAQIKTDSAKEAPSS